MFALMLLRHTVALAASTAAMSVHVNGYVMAVLALLAAWCLLLR
jgi:hypothetical protein